MVKIFIKIDFLKKHLDVKDEVLESMNAKADNMRKTIVDILGEDIGMVNQSSVDTDTLKINHIIWSIVGHQNCCLT